MLRIIGKGGMAREVQSYYYYNNHLLSAPMYEHEEIKQIPIGEHVVIAIGDEKVRQKISLLYPDFVYCFMNFGTCFSRIKFEGAGTIICFGAIVTTNVTLGKHCIINTNAAVHHDCVLGDFVTVSPGAIICGNVTIGDLCFIGANAVIREKITICSEAIIGCGAVVVKDITEPGTYVGNPCKKI